MSNPNPGKPVKPLGPEFRKSGVTKPAPTQMKPASAKTETASIARPDFRPATPSAAKLSAEPQAPPRKPTTAPPHTPELNPGDGEVSHSIFDVLPFETSATESSAPPLPPQPQPQPSRTGLANALFGLAAFDGTETAKVVPPGVYDAEIISGIYSQTVTDPSEVDPGRGEKYVMTFRITIGEYEGEIIRSTRTFGKKSLPYTKAYLAQFGLTNPKDILSPFPFPGKRITCRLIVGLREWNNLNYADVKAVKNIVFEDSVFADLDFPSVGESA